MKVVTRSTCRAREEERENEKLHKNVSVFIILTILYIESTD
jgi:hypothetical protein